MSIAHSISYRTSLGDGVVCKCTQQSIDVALHNKSVDLSAWEIDTHTFAIVRSVNDVTHRRLMGCVLCEVLFKISSLTGAFLRSRTTINVQALLLSTIASMNVDCRSARTVSLFIASLLMFLFQIPS